MRRGLVVLDAWAGRGLLPRRPIVISFDDGHRSHYATAMPILRRHDWPGVLSLTIGNMQGSRPAMRRNQVRRPVQARWESDDDLRVCDTQRLRHEVRDSRRIIRDVLGMPANNFTYPPGIYDQRTVAAVRAAGYRGAMAVSPGSASRRDRFELRRIRVTDGMGAGGLAAALGT